MNGQTATFIDIANLTGSSLDDSFAVSGGTLSGAIKGSGGTDEVLGSNQAMIYMITGTDSGTVAVNGVTTTITDVDNWAGSLQNDTFTFNGERDLVGHD